MLHLASSPVRADLASTLDIEHERFGFPWARARRRESAAAPADIEKCQSTFPKLFKLSWAWWQLVFSDSLALQPHRGADEQQENPSN